MYNILSLLSKNDLSKRTNMDYIIYIYILSIMFGKYIVIMSIINI